MLTAHQHQKLSLRFQALEPPIPKPEHIIIIITIIIIIIIIIIFIIIIIIIIIKNIILKKEVLELQLETPNPVSHVHSTATLNT